jgi:DNA-binding Lrp family transcriptional regulator
MMELDEKNCKILNLLQEDCRISLTKIGEEVGLSVDSVKKRIKKMIREDIFYPKIQLRPRNFGFKNIVNIKIKLHNYNGQDLKKFTDYLKENQHVAEIFCESGEWDFSIVIIAKDAIDQGKVSSDIRNKFSRIIRDWSEALTITVHKFERYDMLKLMGYK